MEAEEFEALRTWASALSSDDRPELRAAAKAITLLADEVERLRIAVWTLTLERDDARAQAQELASGTSRIRASPRRAVSTAVRSLSTGAKLMSTKTRSALKEKR
jgi:hypothetical protein